MKLSSREAGWVVMAGLFLLAPIAAVAAEFKIATVLPENTSWMKEMRAAAADIRERTDGRVTFKFYSGGVQGSPDKVLRKIKIGQLHGGAFTPTDLQQVYADLNIYGLPFLFESEAEVNYVRERVDPALIRGLEEAGFVSFGFAGGGFARVMSNVPVRNHDDLKGRKVWVPEGDLISYESMQALDLSPVTLPLTDVLTGLQTGLIDIVTIWHPVYWFDAIWDTGTGAVSNGCTVSTPRKAETCAMSTLHEPDCAMALGSPPVARRRAARFVAAAPSFGQVVDPCAVHARRVAAPPGGRRRPSRHHRSTLAAVQGRLGGEFDHVMMDNVGGAELATSYMLERGARRIAQRWDRRHLEQRAARLPGHHRLCLAAPHPGTAARGSRPGAAIPRPEPPGAHEATDLVRGARRFLARWPACDLPLQNVRRCDGARACVRCAPQPDGALSTFWVHPRPLPVQRRHPALGTCRI